MSDSSQNFSIENDDFLNSELTPSTIDLDIGVEPNQPLPSHPDEEPDEFDRLLDEFISNQLQDANDIQEETLETIKNKKPQPEELETTDEVVGSLYKEERQLYDAYHNFTKTIKTMARNTGLQEPLFEFRAEMIYPRFRPSRSKIISQDVVIGWDIMLAVQPIRLSSLPLNPTDEQILEFAERTTDELLQTALISYVEILIEIEGCEISYNMRKAKAKKRKIERRIYEEHQQRRAMMKRYIEAIEAQKFPINAERLVTNYFKTAKKDAEGAKKILENNPATFAPIEIDKIPPRLFGMIKPKPEDGIRINKEIGKFLKNLKA